MVPKALATDANALWARHKFLPSRGGKLGVEPQIVCKEGCDQSERIVSCSSLDLFCINRVVRGNIFPTNKLK